MKRILLITLTTIALIGLWTLDFGPWTIQSHASSSDLKVNTTPKADLNASTIRVTVSEFNLDRTLKLNVEKKNAGGAIIDREYVTFTAAEVKSWVNAADPDAWLKTTLLTKIGLTAK